MKTELIPGTDIAGPTGPGTAFEISLVWAHRDDGDCHYWITRLSRVDMEDLSDETEGRFPAIEKLAYSMGNLISMLSGGGVIPGAVKFKAMLAMFEEGMRSDAMVD